MLGQSALHFFVRASGWAVQCSNLQYHYPSNVRSFIMNRSHSPKITSSVLPRGVKVFFCVSWAYRRKRQKWLAVTQKLICVNLFYPLFVVKFLLHAQLHQCSSIASILCHSEDKLSLFFQLRKEQFLGCCMDVGRNLGIQFLLKVDILTTLLIQSIFLLPLLSQGHGEISFQFFEYPVSQMCSQFSLLPDLIHFFFRFTHSITMQSSVFQLPKLSLLFSIALYLLGLNLKISLCLQFQWSSRKQEDRSVCEISYFYTEFAFHFLLT